jgi:hypothetical protein
MDFKDYFIRGTHNTLRLKNSTQFSYKNHAIQVHPNTVIDEWHVGEIMSAEYTIVVDNGRSDKEVIKAIVVAGVDTAGITVIGRSNLVEDIVNITASVNDSSFQLILNPANSSKIGARVMFSATYYQTLTD